MALQRVKIYGERNTGTRVLEASLRQNFSVNILPGHGPVADDQIVADIHRYALNSYEGLLFLEALNDDAILSCQPDYLGWKHACPPLAAIQAYPFLNETLFLIITRDPRDWLYSLHQRPYHKLYQRKLSFSDFIRHYWLGLRRENLPWSLLKNPIQLYMLKLLSYQELLHLSQVLNMPCIHVPYQELLLDFAAVMDTMAAVLTRKSGAWTFPGVSSKGDDMHFEDYQKKYLNEQRFERLSEEDLNFIRAELDLDLLHFWGYEL